jgi:type I restriction enzyme S subunit
MVDQYLAKGAPFLRSLNVRELRFELEKLKFISRDFHERLRKSALSPGDIVVVRSGFVGIACVVPDELKEANCSDLVIARPGPVGCRQLGAVDFRPEG